MVYDHSRKIWFWFWQSCTTHPQMDEHLLLNYKDKCERWMTLWGCASPHCQNDLNFLYNIIHQKRSVHASFHIFLPTLEFFTICCVINQQIITLIGKHVLKIPQMHIITWYTSMNIPKKFEMIWRKLYYTSPQRMNISHLRTRISVHACFQVFLANLEFFTICCVINQHNSMVHLHEHPK